MSDNWVVQNLENALETWNEKLSEIWTLITTTPQNFKGGNIWKVIVDINGAVQAIGLALLVLFFVIGMVKTCGSFTDVKKPEHALKPVSYTHLLRRGQRLWKKTLSISKQRNNNSRERRNHAMNNGGDAAEQGVRLSLEGFEVAARLSGSAAKKIALLLVPVLNEVQKTLLIMLSTTARP